MSASSPPIIRFRLIQLAAHLVVALIALVVIGGATRVMEAGLACPDWPLCFGSFLPSAQMNLQVFLEWFHRLDAFIVGIAFLVQFGIACIWRASLPKWIPWIYAVIVLLLFIQGGLGALTVMQLLPSAIVTIHLLMALTLVAIMSALVQSLSYPKVCKSPLWWIVMARGCLLVTFGQCLLGGRMATEWAAQRCIQQSEACYWLFWHKGSAFVVLASVFVFVFTSLFVGGWPRSQWPFLMSAFALVCMQIAIGYLTIRFGLAQPLVTVAHQLIAALLVAVLAALSFKSPQPFSKPLSSMPSETFSDTSHG